MGPPDTALTNQVRRVSSETLPSASDVAAVVGQSLPGPVRVVSFWIATLLPLVYLPLLALGVPGQRPFTFAGLLALNGLTFVAGHEYKRPS
jgi:hypothetical protein